MNCASRVEGLIDGAVITFREEGRLLKRTGLLVDNHF